jgi:hypothetical protein
MEPTKTTQPSDQARKAFELLVNPKTDLKPILERAKDYEFQGLPPFGGMAVRGGIRDVLKDPAKIPEFRAKALQNQDRVLPLIEKNLPLFQQTSTPIPAPVNKSAADMLKFATNKAGKKVIAVDLDGTLAFSPGGVGFIGKPIKGMMDIVRSAIANGDEVRIFTARAHDSRQIPKVRAWLKEHGLSGLKITNIKTPDIDLFYDDKAMAVHKNKGTVKHAADPMMPPIAPVIPPSHPLPAMRNGKLTYVKDGEVDFEMVNPNHMSNDLANMVPFQSNVKGARLMTSAKFFTQALPLKNGDEPWVENLDEDTGKSYGEIIGHKTGIRKSPIDGKIVAIGKDNISILAKDGKVHGVDIHNYFPHARKTYQHDTPLVKVGDDVVNMQPIAHSNYVSPSGILNMGKNLRVAFMAAPEGATFEDSIAVSETAAKHLTSQGMYGFDVEHKMGVDSNKSKFISLFPNKYTNEQLAKIDENGMLKPGETVSPGDPIVLSFAPKTLSSQEKALGNLHKVLKNTYSDMSQTWEHHAPGIATEARKLRSGLKINIASEAPLADGDKLSGRQGAKGVVKIISDAKMVRDKDGKPMDVIINPAALIGRVNPGMVFDALLGKIAAITGKKYVLPSYTKESMRDFTEHELKKHNISDTEDLYDPNSQKTLKGIMTGTQFFQKLEHMSEGKLSATDEGGSDFNDQPVRGGYGGCFPARQKIRTAMGTIEIARICEKKLGVPVLTYSETLKEWVYRPITDWFVYRSKLEDVLCLEINTAPLDQSCASMEKLVAKQCLYPTKNHLIFTFDGQKKMAGELKIGDELVGYGPEITDHQEQFLWGTMLGDAYCSGEDFVIEHSLKQTEYVDWKMKVLSGLFPKVYDTTKNDKRPSKKRHLARMMNMSWPHICRKMREACYTSEGKKVVTKEWISRLTELSLVAWFLDDGWIGNSAKKKGQVKLRGSIATHGFSKEESEMLREFIWGLYGSKFPMGVDPAYNKEYDKTYYHLRLEKDACWNIIRSVAKWIPWQNIPKTKFTVIKQVRKIQEDPSHSMFSINSKCKLGKIPLRINDIRPYCHDKKDVTEINVYDFTVDDTHTYVAGPALVSNSKRMGGLELASLLSHGATEVIRDAHVHRQGANEDLWMRLRTGETLPAPKSPFIYDKFLHTLKAAGINVKKDNNSLTLHVMTDKDVDTIAPNPVGNMETIDPKTGDPIPGGLFDRGLHGAEGEKWSHIKLDQPYPSPVMEDSVRKLLGITQKDLRNILAGTQTIGGKSGGVGIQNALASLNLDKMKEDAMQDIKSGRATRRDDGIKRLRAITGIQKAGVKPEDLMITKVPVIPPRFRPASFIGNTMMVSDANYLYRDLMGAQKNVSELAKDLPESELANERLSVYDALKAVQGMGDPIHQENIERGVKGFVRQITGVGGPKTGMFLSKVIGHPVNTVGRGAVTPDANLNMDQVGVPEEMAWKMFGPYVMRRMVKVGMPAAEAMKHVDKETDFAKKFLVQEMEKRPVMMTRAPSLHRFNIMGFQGVLKPKTSAISVSPLVVKPFNMDFDGDQANLHVPLSDEAVKEVWDKMLPSKNLFDIKSRKIHYQPSQEFVLGIYNATNADSKQKPAIFNTRAEAMAAYKAKTIDINTPIEILEEKK